MIAKISKARLLKLKKEANLPYLPTQLTFVMRLAVCNKGDRARDWQDKPHRLVYDCCRKIEEDAVIIESLATRVNFLEREIERVRESAW